MVNKILEQADAILQGVDFGVPAGQKLTVMQGQTVRMHVSFSYRGKAINCTLRCSLGQRRAGIFDEIAYGLKTISLPQSVDLESYTAFADISTSPISPGTDYDIEAKISEYAGQTLTKIDNVIDVTGAPEFENFTITSYEAV